MKKSISELDGKKGKSICRTCFLYLPGWIECSQKVSIRFPSNWFLRNPQLGSLDRFLHFFAVAQFSENSLNIKFLRNLLIVSLQKNSSKNILKMLQLITLKLSLFSARQ